MSQQQYMAIRVTDGEYRVYGPGGFRFNPFEFVSCGAEERARLFITLANDAYRQGYEAAKKETAQ